MARTSDLKTGRLLATLGAGLLLAGATGCEVWEEARFKETREFTVEHVDNMPLSVETRNGRVTVRKSDGDQVEVVAELRAVSQERLDFTEVIADRQPDGTLAFSVDWADGERRNNEACSFDISIPNAYGVEIISSNGALDVSGLGGQARLRTSNGRIVAAHHEGDVSARSSNGAIRVKHSTGSIDASSSNGSIVIRDATQGVTADTSNGRVEVEFGSGSAGPVDITTSNGSVDLTLNEHAAGVYSFDTSNGRVHAEGVKNVEILSTGKRHLKIRIGDSDTRSRVRTSNGSITVRMDPKP